MREGEREREKERQRVKEILLSESMSQFLECKWLDF